MKLRFLTICLFVLTTVRSSSPYQMLNMSLNSEFPVHNLKVSSDDVELCYIVTYEKGKSFHYYISYKDSSLCVLSRSIPIDVRDYKQRLYKALSISFAAYLMLED